jgi:hypothetical protein
MARNQRILLLKKAFDPLVKVDEAIYRKLESFLIHKTYQKGAIIKRSGEIEKYTRFVCTGYIAAQWPAEKGRDYRLRVFSPGQVAADFYSYFKNYPFDFCLKALTYTSTFELDYLLENQVLKEIPEIVPLSAAINRKTFMESVHWNQLFSLKRTDGLRFLKSIIPMFLIFSRIRI